VRLSNDAGRYVCERTFRALLEVGRKHAIPAMFLHVPPAKFVDAREQARLVRAMLAAWSGRSARGAAQPNTMRGR
jgi:pyrrolidone-carboxylate peptidase